MFPVIYFIFFLWSIIFLLYALIKRDGTQIATFLILTVMLYITLSDIVYFSNFEALSYVLTKIYGFEP